MTPDILVKYLAGVYLFLIATSAMALGAYDIATGRPVDQYVVSIIELSLATALTTLGYHIGVTNGARVTQDATDKVVNEVADKVANGVKNGT